MEKKIDIFTKAVHAGDRKKTGPLTPSTTPIYTASSYIYESTAQLDRIFADEEAGYSYARYDNPTNAGLQELLTSLEGGHNAIACASGMLAIHLAITAALTDRSKRVVAASAIYGATVKQLMMMFDPMGVEVRWVDICDLNAVRVAIEEHKPGAVVMETISNPLLRVGEMDKIAELTRQAKAALVVDNTFATPMLVRPLELGANFSVHSLTKYLAGHGDVLGGAVITDEEHFPNMRSLSRIYGPVLGPFESYLTMRGIKTFPLRMERQCANACRVASWLAGHPGIERVYFPGDPQHPDAVTIARLFPRGLFGAMISVEIKDADRTGIFAFMDRLKLLVTGTSLGDVHSMILYPAMSSHRDISPKQRERTGIRDNLVRISVGIEAVDDIIADLDQALAR